MTQTQGTAFTSPLVSRDAVLIQRATQGERVALGEIIDRHRDRAYQYAYRLTRNPDDAADLVAEAFVRVSRSIHKFQGNSAFSTWLFRIITNCFYDVHKKESKRRAGRLDDVLQSEECGRARETPAEDVDMVEYLDRGMKAEILADAIDRLPDSYRTIVVMYHCENLGYEEIAEVLAIPLGTVKSRLNRARLALKDSLTGQAELLLA
jgi:RNA polymerase sigma-70 factor (ECF subfamily)